MRYPFRPKSLDSYFSGLRRSSFSHGQARYDDRILKHSSKNNWFISDWQKYIFFAIVNFRIVKYFYQDLLNLHVCPVDWRRFQFKILSHASFKIAENSDSYCEMRTFCSVNWFISNSFLLNRYFHCDFRLKKEVLRPYETLIVIKALMSLQNHYCTVAWCYFEKCEFRGNKYLNANWW